TDHNKTTTTMRRYHRHYSCQTSTPSRSSNTTILRSSRRHSLTNRHHISCEPSPHRLELFSVSSTGVILACLGSERRNHPDIDNSGQEYNDENHHYLRDDRGHSSS